MKIRLTARARRDLVDIADYTVRHWGIRQRNLYLQQLEKRLQWLAEHPGLGVARDDIKEGYFCYPQGEHLIFFLRTDSSIDIIGIPHQEMDVMHYFDE